MMKLNRSVGVLAGLVTLTAMAAQDPQNPQNLLTRSLANAPEASALGRPAGRGELRFDFPGIRIGTAEYAEGPTGCTVLHFPAGALAALDVRGGAAAVREGTSVEPLNTWGAIDALVLAGGSTYGLEAASGVMKRILENRGNKTDFANIPSVPAAIVYDFAGRENSLYPDKELGARAFDSARANVVETGAAGAGANVSVGKYFGRKFAERSGQGAAFHRVGDARVLVLTVVNAVGNVMNADGSILAGSLDRERGERFSIVERLMKLPGTAPTSESLENKSSDSLGNTTITAVVTNVKFDRNELQRLAAMAHTAMARAIEPFHTPSDGDVLFALSTSSVEKTKALSVGNVGVIAGKLLQDAVRSAVKTASSPAR